MFAGIMSSCMAFGIAAGKPIAEFAIKKGTASLWQNSPVLVIVLAGGCTTNLIWCVILNIRNKTMKDYSNAKNSPLLNNYIFSALAGITWYLQFMFYGMGTTKMGAYDFSSWTIHMAFVIVFSNLWGLYFNEWKGSSSKTLRLIVAGIFVVFMSTVLIGLGNYLVSTGK
jgi:L-rhamnose-H+ transport protein